MSEEIVDFEIILTPPTGKVFAATPGFVACRMVEVPFMPEDYADIADEDPEVRAKYIVDITEDEVVVGLYFPNGAKARDRRDELHLVESVEEMPKAPGTN